MEELKQAVIFAAKLVCENAAFLPDRNVQISVEITEALGEALCNLADAEREKYKENLFGEQQGLSLSQVTLQRAFMSEKELMIERLIDAADQLYLAFFDEVVVPGHIYLSTAKSKTPELRYCSKESIQSFLECHAQNRENFSED